MPFGKYDGMGGGGRKMSKLLFSCNCMDAHASHSEGGNLINHTSAF